MRACVRACKATLFNAESPPHSQTNTNAFCTTQGELIFLLIERDQTPLTPNLGLHFLLSVRACLRAYVLGPGLKISKLHLACMNLWKRIKSSGQKLKAKTHTSFIVFKIIHCKGVFRYWKLLILRVRSSLYTKNTKQESNLWIRCGLYELNCIVLCNIFWQNEMSFENHILAIASTYIMKGLKYII